MSGESDRDKIDEMCGAAGDGAVGKTTSGARLTGTAVAFMQPVSTTQFDDEWDMPLSRCETVPALDGVAACRSSDIPLVDSPAGISIWLHASACASMSCVDSVIVRRARTRQRSTRSISKG